MFFILSKALLFIISPFVWFIALLLYSFYTKKPKSVKRFRFAALFVFLFFTNSFIFNFFCSFWEVPGKRAEHLTKSYDIGIVLTGMAEYDNHLNRLSLRRGGDRIWQAIGLYKAGKIKKIFISGKSGYVTDRGLEEAAQFKSILVSWGIPKEDILIENKSVNTHGNAVETQIVLKKYPLIKSHLLITSGTHMRRSLACFEKVGLHCDSYSTDLFTSPTNHYFWDQFLIPNVNNFEDWNKLIKEWVGYVSYWMVGYI